MARQSARLLNNKKDHKDIFFNGNYHKQMWITDKNANPTLLWEKLEDSDEYKGLELTYYVKYGASTIFIQIAGSFTVDWGDGTVETLNVSALSYVHHDYSAYVGYGGGVYVNVLIKGNVTDLTFMAANYLVSVNSALPPTLEKTDFKTMFAYLNDYDFSINSDLFKYCGNVTDFSSCFYNTWLNAIPEGLFDNCVSARTVKSCFKQTHVSSVPNGLFANLISLEDISYCFDSCTLLTNIGEDILSNCKQIENAEYFCRGCTKLECIPYTLFDDCEKLNNVIGSFYTCSEITSKLPPLWERDVSVWGGTYANTRGCYYRCTKAENYKEAYSVGLFTSRIS